MKKRSKILIVDNYDSFTYNLYDYFLQLETDCTVLRNDAFTEADFPDLSFDGLVLSPGPQKPVDAGLLLPLIKYFHTKKPILGICLGHQAIGEFFGATLTKAKIPIHGKTSDLKHHGHPIFQGLPDTFAVMRYHSLILEDVKNTPLLAIAQSSEEELMAVAHRTLPIAGFQFHPESILTEHGLKLLHNWLHCFVN